MSRSHRRGKFLPPLSFLYDMVGLNEVWTRHLLPVFFCFSMKKLGSPRARTIAFWISLSPITSRMRISKPLLKSRLGSSLSIMQEMYVQGSIAFCRDCSSLWLQVTYQVAGFLEKNRDPLGTLLISCMQGSQLELLKSLFPEDLRAPIRSQNRTVGSAFRVSGPTSHLFSYIH